MSDRDRVLLREVLDKLDQVLELLQAEPVEKYIVIDGELRRLVDGAPPGAIPLNPDAGIFNLIGCATEDTMSDKDRVLLREVLVRDKQGQVLEQQAVILAQPQSPYAFPTTVTPLFDAPLTPPGTSAPWELPLKYWPDTTDGK